MIADGIVLGPAGRHARYPPLPFAQISAGHHLPPPTEGPVSRTAGRSWGGLSRAVLPGGGDVYQDPRAAKPLLSRALWWAKPSEKSGEKNRKKSRQERRKSFWLKQGHRPYTRHYFVTEERWSLRSPHRHLLRMILECIWAADASSYVARCDVDLCRMIGSFVSYEVRSTSLGPPPNVLNPMSSIQHVSARSGRHVRG